MPFFHDDYFGGGLKYNEKGILSIIFLIFDTHILWENLSQMSLYRPNIYRTRNEFSLLVENERLANGDCSLLC